MVKASDAGLIQKEVKFQTHDINNMAEMLEWAGISFGEEEMFKLNKSIKCLAQMSGATSINFMGKIYGAQKDYWVC